MSAKTCDVCGNKITDDKYTPFKRKEELPDCKINKDTVIKTTVSIEYIICDDCLFSIVTEMLKTKNSKRWDDIRKQFLSEI